MGAQGRLLGGLLRVRGLVIAHTIQSYTDGSSTELLWSHHLVSLRKVILLREKITFLS